MAPLKRDTVTKRDKSQVVTAPAGVDGLRDTRDNNPIGVVTLSRPSRPDAPDAPLVELLPFDQAWGRGDHSARRIIQLRPSDTAMADRLTAGTGQRADQYDRYLYQRGVAAELQDRAAKQETGK